MNDIDQSVTASEPASDRAALLIAAGSSAVAFMVGFNYGAFDAVFFDQVFTVWVVATIVLGASLITDLPPHTWPRRAVLLLPTVWLIVSWINNNLDLENSDAALTAVTVAVTLVALPFVGWFVITAINTEFANLPRKHKTAVLLTVGFFLVLGFVFGARNDTMLTCDDFKISGNDQPANCLPAANG